MDGRTSERTNERTNQRTNERTNERTNQQTNERTNELTHVRGNNASRFNTVTDRCAVRQEGRAMGYARVCPPGLGRYPSIETSRPLRWSAFEECGVRQVPYIEQKTKV